MSLFSQLRRLYRPDRFQFEDFHTEIVAQVLQNSPGLTRAWLNGIGATSLRTADNIKVRTQEEFHPLTGHATASRPDITIRLFCGSERELIFIESKQGSTQGLDQLQRYADHLHAAQLNEGFDRVSLVFITRVYEASETPLLANSQFPLNFQRTRWFLFYRHLKAHVNSDGFDKELMLFMQENRMSLGTQFRSIDLVSLESFLSAKALMDETLEGEVSDAAWKILGNISTLKKAPNQLRDHERYVIFAGFGTWDYECLIGYWLPGENPDESVTVGIILGSNPNTQIGKMVIDAFREWVKKSGNSWSIEKINDVDWSEIRNRKPIQTFLVEEDHVRAIKNYLLRLLEDVREFKAAFPALAWGQSSEDVV